MKYFIFRQLQFLIVSFSTQKSTILAIFNLEIPELGRRQYRDPGLEKTVGSWDLGSRDCNP